MRALRLLPLLLLIATVPAPAAAADRGYTVTDFDRIRAEGPFDITVRVGLPPAVRAHGLPVALDRLDVEVRGDTLVIRPDHLGWGGWPGGAAAKVTLTVTVPMLRAIAIAGSGDMTVDRMKGAQLQLYTAGSGNLAVAQLQAEKLGVSVAGSGRVTLAGRAMQADVTAQGSGDLDAAALTVADATLALQGSGDLGITATHTARVASAGSGDVTIAGPAACTVSQAGSGEVRCGHKTGG